LRWQGAPLRTRLTAAAAIAATATIVAVVAVAYIAVRHELLSNLDSQLRSQSSGNHFIQLNTSLQPQVIKDAGQSAADVQVVETDGSTIGEQGGYSLPVAARDVRIATHGGSWLRTESRNDRPLRILTVRRDATANDVSVSVALQVALPLSATEDQLHKVRYAFLLLALLGLAMVIVLSWLLVRQTMRPVAKLTRTAEQIAETRDLTTRIDDYGSDELGRLASTFNMMLDALERSLNQQRQLILDASHELRTPLASLRTNVEVLNDVERLTVSQRQALLAGIVTQLDELTGLVADVVELARGEAQAGALENIAFDDLVAHAVDRARRYWPNLVFHLETVPTVVSGVPARLDRAVANLLDNAGKFSPAGGEVDVDLSATGGLTVADHGPGIPEDALEHVFDRFYRADEARAMPGSGLGLSIVKQVVDGLGGTVTLSNRPGGGALARLVLPVSGEQHADDGERVESGAVEPVG
jgi:two-component system sensor histidine kinase MprB